MKFMFYITLFFGLFVKSVLIFTRIYSKINFIHNLFFKTKKIT